MKKFTGSLVSARPNPTLQSAHRAARLRVRPSARTQHQMCSGWPSPPLRRSAAGVRMFDMYCPEMEITSRLSCTLCAGASLPHVFNVVGGELPEGGRNTTSLCLTILPRASRAHSTRHIYVSNTRRKSSEFDLIFVWPPFIFLQVTQIRDRHDFDTILTRATKVLTQKEWMQCSHYVPGYRCPFLRRG